MRSRRTTRFGSLFEQLPAEVQQSARHAYVLFQRDPAHPSLQFKRLRADRQTYSIRVGLGYRALGIRFGDGTLVRVRLYLDQQVSSSSVVVLGEDIVAKIGMVALSQGQFLKKFLEAISHLVMSLLVRDGSALLDRLSFSLIEFVER